MQQHTDATTPHEAERIFYYMAIALMLMAIATSFIQKRRESAVAIAGATRAAIGAERADEFEGDVRQNVEAAERWQMLSLAAVLLGVLSGGVAIWRREKPRWGWACVVVLLFLAVMLQLMMV